LQTLDDGFLVLSFCFLYLKKRHQSLEPMASFAMAILKLCGGNHKVTLAAIDFTNIFQLMGATGLAQNKP
jgi:hypothetical protein